MYILGIPQGWSLGRGPVFFFRTWTGGTILSPAVHVTTCVDRLGSADRQVAPSEVIDPLRTSPEILLGLLAYVSCMLKLPPQVGVLGSVPPSTLAAIPLQAVAYH